MYSHNFYNEFSYSIEDDEYLDNYTTVVRNMKEGF